jgi:hypothetical protein
MSNLFKTVTVFGILYFSIHIVYGYLSCASNFCPGDNERDYVYEYTDDSGKKFIVEDGATVPKEQYNGQK